MPSFLRPMRASLHNCRAHKCISTNEPHNRTASSSVIDHGLSPPSSPYSNHHYAKSMASTHPPLPPHWTRNGATYELSSASWDGADHSTQKVHNMPPSRGCAPRVVPFLAAYPEYHFPRTHEEGVSGHFAWSSPWVEPYQPICPPTVPYSSSAVTFPPSLYHLTPYNSQPDSAPYTGPDTPNLNVSQRPTAASVPGAFHARSSTAQGHFTKPQSSPSPPPNIVHTTLSSWLKNMNKLDSLIDHLKELASSTPAAHRYQLLNKVAALRVTFTGQQEHFREFLQLSEEYANRYLLDISAKILRQSSFLEKLEKRLEAAKKLQGEAANLQKWYESGTVAIMKDLRTTTLSRPLPQDSALFIEVDFMMAKIRRFHETLNKFWTEEIRHVAEALEKRRIDPKDFKHWNDFRSSLRQTIELWKNRPPSGDAQTLRRNNTSSSTGVDLGAIAASLSLTIGFLEEALDRIFSSASLRYSQSGPSSIQRVYVAFAANSDMCLSFLQLCADYGEKMVARCLPSIPLPASTCVDATHDLRERTMSLQSEMTGLPAENVASVQGSRKLQATFNKALSLEQKMTSGLNTLLEELSSWVMVTDCRSLPDDTLDVATLKQLGELWKKTGYSVRAALVTLEDEPAPRRHYRSTPPASIRSLSVMK